MVIIKPKRADNDYSQPAYTLVFATGLMERADNYAQMYVNPSAPLKYKLPDAKYTASPFQ